MFVQYQKPILSPQNVYFVLNQDEKLYRLMQVHFFAAVFEIKTYFKSWNKHPITGKTTSLHSPTTQSLWLCLCDTQEKTNYCLSLTMSGQLKCTWVVRLSGYKSELENAEIIELI